MNWFSGLKVPNVCGSQSVAELEAEKEREITKLTASYNDKIAAAREKEAADQAAAQSAAPAADGNMATNLGGRRRKTRRSKKSKRSRTGRKSTPL